MAFLPVECADCGAHYQLDPSGDIQGSVCDACGGNKFVFMNQPSATKPDYEHDETTPSDDASRMDNPLSQGTIMGNDGERPADRRDNFMHANNGSSGKFAGDAQANYVNHYANPYGRDTAWPEGLPETTQDWHDFDTNEQVESGYGACPRCNPHGIPQGGGLNLGGICNQCGYHIGQDGASYDNPTGPTGVEHEDWGAENYEPRWGKTADANTRVKRCPNCGSGSTRIQAEGDPSNEDALEQAYCPACHTTFKIASSATERVEPMRPPTLNMEPYAPLWSDEHVAGTHKIAGPAALVPLEVAAAPEEAAAAGAAAGGIADAAGSAGGAIGDAASGAWNAGKGLIDDIFGGGGNAAKFVGKKLLTHGVSHLMEGALKDGAGALGIGGGGAQAGGMAPQSVAPAPNMMQFGSVGGDIIMALASDLETSDSVKSVDEHHDDPEKQDQKEFNDSDKSPKNIENPNLDDSGGGLEDGVKQGIGFSEDSPALDRLQMILPLVLHYFNSEESGGSDPIIRGLHEALDAENPGYLKNKSPHGEQAVQVILQGHKQPPKQAGVNALPGGLPAVPTPGGELPANNPAQTTGGQCPLCGGVLAADGSCPQCGFKQHPQGGPSQSAGSGSVSIPNQAQPFVGKVANNVGPTTPEQKAAVIELLQHQHREAEIPYVETEPWRFAKELAQIQGNPNTAPLVDPSQENQTPPPAMMGAPGAMPVQDPSQPAGGMAQPMQPMANVHEADANTRVKRCPNCGSGSTRIQAEGDPSNEDALEQGYCPACGNVFKIANRVILAEVPNPAMEDASTLHDVRPEDGHDPSRTWIDQDGNPLQVGQTYDLYTSGIPTPDVVKVVSKKPDELGLKLVGEFSNVHPDPVDDQSPDFKINPQQMREQRYTFQLSDTDQQGSTQGAPQGGMPGMDQIPQTPPTTDEVGSQYPNGGATISASVVASDDEYDMDDPDMCHHCGNDRIYHTASSPTRTMHECDRCGTAWEIEDSDYGERTASQDLSWLYNEGPSNDSFFEEMERAKSMYSNQSRNISSIAANDKRLAEIHARLERNATARTAGRHFTPLEQKGLINESGRARNADKLDLSGTHYEAASMVQAFGYDPRDPKNRANGENAPDEHIVFGL